MTRENAMQFFSRKTGFIIWLVGIVGLCMIYVGYAGERRSVIFMVIGAVLILLCLLEAITSKRHMKNGAELDAMAKAELKGRDILGMALTKLCLSRDDVAGLEKFALRGYCAFPMQTRPYYRRDETDKKLRTSNYQTSLFIFRKDRLYAYSYIVSLVDKEKSESGRMWRYGDIRDVRIAHEELTYLVGTSDEQRETAEIEYLSLTDVDGRHFAFFFGEGDNGATTAEQVLQLIEAGRSAAPEADAYAADDTEPAELDFSADDSAPSAARGRDLEIDIIGTELKDCVK